MLTFSFGETFQTPCALLLGGFDGLHRGHRALLNEAKCGGLPVCMTTMYGGKGGELFTRKERRFLFEEAGVSALCELVFDDVCNLPAEEFLHTLFHTVRAEAVFCGEDFRFGKDALGTPELLRALAPCPVQVVSAVQEDAGDGMRKISASGCKEDLKRGDLPALNARLSSDAREGAYFIGGIVEHGRQVGRTYGFPTLNLTAPPQKLLPPDGVYAGLCATPEGKFKTIVNIGARPTFGIGELKIEAYLDGFSGDLYGAYVRVYPMEFYRPVSKFPSVEALREQLSKDIQRLRGNKG